MTSRVFEVRNSTDLVDPFEYLRVGKLETDCQGRRSAVMMELATALLLDVHDYSNFSTAVLHGTMETPSNNYAYI